MTWIEVADGLPVIGQRIVAEYKTGQVWAGRYFGVKQNFLRWLALP